MDIRVHGFNLMLALRIAFDNCLVEIFTLNMKIIHNSGSLAVICLGLALTPSNGAVISLGSSTAEFSGAGSFGGGLVDQSNAAETAFVGVAPALRTDLYTPFNPVATATDSFPFNANTDYFFSLTYTASSTLTFRIFPTSARTTQVNWSGSTPTETDLYNDTVMTADKQNINNLKGFYLRLFSDVNGSTVNVSGLTLGGGDQFAGNVSTWADSYTFTGDGTANGSLSQEIFIGATGLSNGFTLDGIFNLNSIDGDNADNKRNVGFAIYAAVPEPATVAFGLALVGGLGLLEIRRRKVS